MNWEQAYKDLKVEYDKLKAENFNLKKQLGILPSASESAVPNQLSHGAAVHMHSPAEEKIALFRRLFHGRDDVYAKRWYSEKLQKGGYAPVCENEWQDGLCNKKAYKCSKCPNRKLASLSDKAVYAHLSGKDSLCRDVIGLYPMLLDESCFFLVMDFDGENWQTDVSVMRSICLEQSISPAVERSRSGNGAHLWIFFSEPISCALARKLGSGLLTQAMERNHQLKFDSYDRLFPNQDTLPSGGFGNLIALPLQGQVRKMGNSVFMDEEMRPYEDQWAFLAKIEKLTKEFVTQKAETLCGGGELGVLVQESVDELPWEKKVRSSQLTAFDFNGGVELICANRIYVKKSGVSEGALNRIKRLAAFKNPDFYKAQAMRLPTYNKPRVICTADESKDYLGIPRGCFAELITLLDKVGANYRVDDKTNSGRVIRTSFVGELREEQAEAAKALLAENNGILSATTAFGKTVVAAYIIGQRKVNTLVLVHTQALLNQWKGSLERFLEINEQLPELPNKRGRKKQQSLIGQLGGTKNQLSGIVDVAIMQSLIGGGEVLPLVKDYGMVIVDECHHVSAVSFEAVLQQANAKYVYGLTATPVRQDGHQPIIYMQCGPIRYCVDIKEQTEKRSFTHAVLPRFTQFATPLSVSDEKWTITDIYGALCENQSRNERIIGDVIESLKVGRTPILLTERYAHAEILAEMLEGHCMHVVLLSGKGTAKEKRERIESLNNLSDQEPLVIVATGKYVGEGFDFPRLDTLFLAMPIAWSGTLAQYAGRLHRDYVGKTEVLIYDYVDARIPMLERMYQKRLSAYATMGYKTKAFLSEVSESAGIIFSEKTFLPILSQDITGTIKELVIVSPFLTKNRLTQFVKLFQEPMLRGVKVVVATRPASDFKDTAQAKTAELIATLESSGVIVLQKEKIHQKFALVDARIAWYGSINLLSFGKSEESMMRLENPEVAAELHETIRDTSVVDY